MIIKKPQVQDVLQKLVNENLVLPTFYIEWNQRMRKKRERFNYIVQFQDSNKRHLEIKIKASSTKKQARQAILDLINKEDETTKTEQPIKKIEQQQLFQDESVNKTFVNLYKKDFEKETGITKENLKENEYNAFEQHKCATQWFFVWRWKITNQLLDEYLKSLDRIDIPELFEILKYIPLHLTFDQSLLQWQSLADYLRAILKTYTKKYILSNAELNRNLKVYDAIIFTPITKDNQWMNEL